MKKCPRTKVKSKDNDLGLAFARLFGGLAHKNGIWYVKSGNGT
jgi:hypothetical protein